ncbi:MAG: hypothetical protein J6Y37_05975 [Paludibacteraceae bacterium]|nr:hypothetical protein [Paludibacteraceae bacterium]
MKKQFIAIPIAVLTLSSCGSGTQNQNMDGQTVEETTSATSTQQKVELTQDVLKDIWKQVNNSDAGEDAEYTADRVFLNEVPFGNTEVKVFRIDDTSFKVFCLRNKMPDNPMDYPDGAEYEFNEYLYSNGKLAESKLQSELQGNFGVCGDFSHGDTLKFLDENDNSTLFVWDGSQMERIGSTASSK